MQSKSIVCSLAIVFAFVASLLLDQNVFSTSNSSKLTPLEEAAWTKMELGDVEVDVFSISPTLKVTGVFTVGERLKRQYEKPFVVPLRKGWELNKVFYSVLDNNDTVLKYEEYFSGFVRIRLALFDSTRRIKWIVTLPLADIGTLSRSDVAIYVPSRTEVSKVLLKTGQIAWIRSRSGVRKIDLGYSSKVAPDVLNGAVKFVDEDDNNKYVLVSDRSGRVLDIDGKK